jgi:hypothetical protein
MTNMIRVREEKCVITLSIFGPKEVLRCENIGPSATQEALKNSVGSSSERSKSRLSRAAEGGEIDAAMTRPKDKSWVGGEVCGGAVGASTHEPMTYDFPEIYMAKHRFERPSPQRIPLPPAPSSIAAPEGMERARALARRYLFDAVRLLAGIAFAPDSEAALHTRMLCAKEIVAIAGVIPQATPAPPPYERVGDSSEPD